MELVFRAVAEDRPGKRWAQLFRELWPHYEAWYLSQGQRARPTWLECETALKRYLPSYLPTWRKLMQLSGGSDLAARFLSLWRPPPYATGCSQAAWAGPRPVLVRNYDYPAELCEALLLRTAWSGRAVLASSDCLVGVLDGVNQDGLCVALSFGGSREVGDGFGAPLVLRHVLETCATADEAIQVLVRVPTHLGYNITVLDRSGVFATVYTGPGRRGVVQHRAAATNHRDEIDWPEHANATATHERLALLDSLIADPATTREGLVSAFLRPPLMRRGHWRGLGTLYTAAWDPIARTVDLHWPQETWHLALDDFLEGERRVRLTA